MTIAEAVSLVLQAFAIGGNGDILVLDMGEPVRVADLAKNLARLSGKSRQEFKFIASVRAKNCSRNSSIRTSGSAQHLRQDSLYGECKPRLAGVEAWS